MMLDKFELQRLRDLPIEGVAERLGLRVVRHKSLCPFHEDRHPSLSYRVSRNTCRCFVCMNQSIGPIDLVMRYLHVDFKEACRWLGGSQSNRSHQNNQSNQSNQNNRNNQNNQNNQNPPNTLNPPITPSFSASRYERFFEHPWLSDEARRFLFGERRLDERVVRWCRLSSWRDRQGIPWLQIPYYSQEGRLIGVQNRRLEESEGFKEGQGVKGFKGAEEFKEVQGLKELKGVPRFRFPQGSECGIYNLPVLNRLKAGEKLYITEGCSDCWAMLSAGHKTIAIPSATLLKRKDVELLSTLNSELSTEFHMYPDCDVPGERLFLQLKEMLPNLVRHQLPPGCKDFSDYYVGLKTGSV